MTPGNPWQRLPTPVFAFTAAVGAQVLVLSIAIDYVDIHITHRPTAFISSSVNLF